MATDKIAGSEGGMGGFSSRGPKAPKVKINSNPNTTPAKRMKGPTDSNSKYSWSHNEWNSKEGVDDYGNPTYNPKAPINPIKVNTNPVKTSGLAGKQGKLGGQHMGGHAGH